MNVSVFIGRRLSFRGGDGSSRRAGGSAGVPLAVGGIALALIIMMVSIAVVVGFKEEIRRKVEGFNSEITIYPQSRTLASVSAIDFTDELAGIVDRAAGQGARAAGVVELPGILKTDSAFQGVMIKALPADADGARFIASHLTEGRMPSEPGTDIDPATGAPPQPEIALSASVASRLGLALGDKVDMHFVTSGALKTRRAVVGGIFDTHFGEYDTRFAYVAPGVARSIGGLAPGEVTSVEVNGLPQDMIPDATSALSTELLEWSADGGPGTQRPYFVVDNLLRSGQAYFSWLDLLDTNVVVILVLMALVSGFTLISSLFILILERVRTIGILKSLGATNGQIRGIFIYMAERLVVRGLVIGNAIALGFIALQHSLHLIPLDAEAYFLNYVPVSIGWPAVVGLNAAVIVISGLLLIAPSHMIATLSPSESMRYE